MIPQLQSHVQKDGKHGNTFAAMDQEQIDIALGVHSLRVTAPRDTVNATIVGDLLGLLDVASIGEALADPVSGPSA